MIRVLFLIRSLVNHGAERQLTELVKALDRKRFAATVVTFYDGGALRPQLEGLERVQVLSLHKQSRWDLAAFALPLWRIVHKVKPHIVHGYMGIANELCLFMGRVNGAKVVWGLRDSGAGALPREAPSPPDARLRIGPRLSRFADLIIVNSQAGRDHHIGQGYHADRMVVIPNGIDVVGFHPNCEAGSRMRRAWGVADGEQLIGLVGRFDAVKDHPTFLRAAALLAQRRRDVRFVCVGGGPPSHGHRLEVLAEELGLGKRLVWAGECTDMQSAYNALDILVSSSVSEGFSNVIGEAMACGVPCVGTDVGDTALIVGKGEQVVPPRDPQALERACSMLLDLPLDIRAKMSRAVRERIETTYSTVHLVRNTEAALLSLLDSGMGAPATGHC